MSIIQSHILKIIGVILLLTFFYNAKAQLIIDENNKSAISFQWDNDVLFHTDYYYSQGLFFKLYSPKLEKNPLNYLLFNLPNSKNTYSLNLIQQVFTPLEIRDSVVRIDDRPYAGLLYLRSEKVSVNSNFNMILRSSMDLGIRGPYSFAQQTQYYYHKIGSIVLPQGWKYQLTNFPVINYNLAARKALYNYSNYDEFSGTAEVRAGSIYNDISIGAHLKLGLFDNIFGDKISDFEFYSTFDASMKYVFYNGTLQGDLKNNPNPHQIYPPDINDFVFSYSAKASLRYRKFGINFSWFYLSPEFLNAKNHRYNSLSLQYYW